ncbi:glycosyl hydrolase [Achaetomium macrosporum]|uniref:Glycosyl hydrolase n=1 Tax=Achaetomium macrosporum TaxID=79813 RepID=A0AAN7CDM4_9PEZI|nr:glycosyl hydrolase [Achaetomium macrosporum]
MRFTSGLTLALAGSAAAKNSTYYNPILPGWHSDPSCIQVGGIFYCVTSTFISFPGLPIYASKDLINWKHVSHVWHRESQLPGYSWATNGQQQGMYAATIRFRHGIFYVICEYLGVPGKDSGIIFKSTNPFSDASWSNAISFTAPKIDPDLFWDDDGNGTDKAYVATQGIQLQQIDLTTGQLGPAIPLWNGTGGVWPEGPHLYRHSGYYYLLIAEGGTAQDHAITMARSRALTGPYTPCPHNPVLTNRGTQEYFQTVGHGDLFQDTKGNWWGVALATRSGPGYRSYPMGRETVLFPVTWREGGDWPVLQPVRGRMSGWRLPQRTRDVPGTGPFNDDPDVYDFGRTGGKGGGAIIPRNLVHWRVPRAGAFEVTMGKGLRVLLGRNRLDGWPGGDEPAAKAVSFIGRRQTDSLFRFRVDLEFEPSADGQEAGVTAFLTQQANVQLGVVLVGEQLSFRFNVSGEVTERAVPKGWVGKLIRMEIKMAKPTEYIFSAALASDAKTRIELGTASAELLSGGSGSFVGTLIGVYATCNGAGRGVDCPAGTPNAYFRRWRYTGDGQFYTETKTIPRGGKARKG